MIMLNPCSALARAIVIGLWLLLTTHSALASPEGGQSDKLAVPGGIYRWTPPSGATDIRFNNRPVRHVGYQVFVGVPLSQTLGDATISYRLNDASLTHAFSVTNKAYTEQHITLKNRAMVNPSEKQLARIRRESQRQRALYLRYSEIQSPIQSFEQPLQGRISSLFGHRRFFNGEARSPHSGLDIAAPQGSEITAPANATVTLVDDLYYNGKTVFLDHGEGLITMYCHLSEPLVTEGERVEQGQIIGLVGATGRATGPHLHWSVSLNGYRVDPQSMMAMLNP